jgi:hypothetical protein
MTPKDGPSRSPRGLLSDPLLVGIALAASLLPPALLLWRLGRWPGWELTDESWTLSLWQRWREGLPPEWIPTQGCFHRAFVAGMLAVGGWNFAALRAASLLLYASFVSVFWLLGRKLFGPTAALAAVCVAGAAALPAVHLGSVLSPQMQPLLWSAFAFGLFTLESPRAAFLWGLCAGLFLLDYDGWIVALPGLFLLFLLVHGWRRLALAAAGFVLVGALLAALNIPEFSRYAASRRSFSQPHSALSALNFGFSHLEEFFFGGGRALPTQGVPAGAPQFPLWALPFLAAAPLALFRADGPPPRVQLGLWICALLPFAAFFLHSPAVPSERVLAAWPPLCLLAGLSLEWLWRKRQGSLPLAIWIAAGGALEACFFIHGYSTVGDSFYGGGDALLAAAHDLRTGPPPELFSELDAAPRGDLRLALELPDSSLRDGPPIALVPWELVPAFQKPGLGAWKAFPAGGSLPDRWLYRVPPQEVPMFREAHRTLKDFWDRERSRFYKGVYADLLTATSRPIANPIVRDALWEARFLDARRTGAPEPHEGETALALGMLRVDPLLREARDEMRSDPSHAEHLYREALKRDPRRREAWRGLRNLVQARGDRAALAELDRAIDALPANATFEPFWLRE